MSALLVMQEFQTISSGAYLVFKILSDGLLACTKNYTVLTLSPTAEKRQLLHSNKLHMKIKLSIFFSTYKSPVLPFCSIWLKHLSGFRHQLTDSPEKHTFVMSLFLHLGRFVSQNRGDTLLPDPCGEDVVLCIFANLDSLLCFNGGAL